MKYLALLVGLAGAIGLASGCGGKDHPTVIDSGDPTGGKTTRGGTHSGGTTGAPGGDSHSDGGAGGAVAADGLTVTISSPSASSDPNVDEVIITDKVTVTCAVDGSMAGVRVDPASVTLQVLDADGKPANGLDLKPLIAPGVPTGNPDEYSASFGLGSVPTGVVSFRCSAKALQSPETGTTTLSTFVDHGPTITAKLPEEGSAHALKGVLPVEFTVMPTPLTKGDTGAAVDSVKLQVAGVEIDDIVEDPKIPGTWRASVDFTDGALFHEQPPEHTSVHITASNVRSPKAVTAVKDYPFVVDGKGPVIAITSPKDNSPVHGETIITFTASDSGAGLDIDTLYVGVTGLGPSVKFDPSQKGVWSRNGDVFTFRFDTAVLKNVQAQIAIDIRASDAAGNKTDAPTLFLYEDDKPPSIDLDPGNARVFDSQKYCTASFDPLGEALNDGATTTRRTNLLRALVYDQTNQGDGQPVLYFSGTERGSVRLYAQVDATQPFLVDTNKDGVCDSLARDDFPYQSLKPVFKNGTFQYSTTDYATLPAVDSGGADCKLKGPQPNLMTACAGNSDLLTIVQHDVVAGAASNNDEPVVYGLGSLMGAECTGTGWDLGLIPGAEGWLCLAARAVDNLGNAGVSRPLRICFDNPDTPDFHPACVNGGPPPSCTTACTAPPAFGPHIYKY